MAMYFLLEGMMRLENKELSYYLTDYVIMNVNA
jgi:hypothetical protein